MKLILDKNKNNIELKLRQDGQYFDITNETIKLNIDVSAQGTVATVVMSPESILVGTDEVKLKIGDKLFKLLGIYE